MDKKIKFISIIILIIICIIVFFGLYYIYSNDSRINIDLNLYIEIAENETSCSDIRNELYLIDDNMIFWVVEGSCSDASYSYTLFGDDTKKVLCKISDSIAGPQETCNDEKYQEIFDIMKNNISEYNFGLDNSYNVTKFFQMNR